jgi:hypothetical protein
MTLAVENGTGLANAESYISVADASTRHTALGNAAWAALANDTLREQALRRATQYMEQAYRERWQGVRLNATQALSWPRWDVWTDGYPVAPDAVPAAIANACADLALKALAGDLNADLTREVIREKVGPLETEYSPHSPRATQFRAIDMMLAPYLSGSGANARLIRA